MFIVMCRVSGGVTGTREAVLKSNGMTQYFETREAAETEAKRLTAQMNADRYRSASFQYWAEQSGW